MIPQIVAGMLATILVGMALLVAIGALIALCDFFKWMADKMRRWA